jgi:hypothetical protein
VTWNAPVLTRRRSRVAPLSFAQERLWFIDAASPGSATYNVPLLMRWHQPVDLTALATALAAVSARHEVLRTTYQVREGRPVQIVGDPEPIPVEVVELGDRPDAWDRARQDAARQAREPFDLGGRAPVRCVVWRGVPGGDAVLLCIHHIAIDGWSLSRLFEDLEQAYDAAVAGQQPRLGELSIQYADFAVWDREMFADPTMQQRLDDRLEELLQVPAGLVLGGSRAPVAAPEGERRGGQYVFGIPAAVASGVSTMATTLRATPFVILFAAFQVVLQRWSDREEFLVGTVTVSRPHQALEELIGFFVNTVPLRCRLQADWSFSHLCEHVRTEAFKGLAFQRIPFEQLTKKATAARSDGRCALVNVGFALQNMPAPQLSTRPRWTTPSLLHTGTAKFDLTLLLEDGPDGFVGTVEYDIDCYSAEVGRQLGENFRALLAAAVAKPECLVRQLPITESARGEPPAGVLVGVRHDLAAERLARLGVAVSEQSHEVAHRAGVRDGVG